MDTLTALFENWVAREPAVSLWLLVSAALLAGVTLSRGGGRAWWEALAQAVSFAGLVGLFYFLLSSDYTAFAKIHQSFVVAGSLSQQRWEQWRQQYGGAFVQEDLQATQYLTHTTTETLPPTPPRTLPLYRNRLIEEAIQQNSILGFQGQVTITLPPESVQGNAFNGYELVAHYQYTVTNPTTATTRAVFHFPLSAWAIFYEAFRIEVNGVALTTGEVTAQAVRWEARLPPGAQQIITVHYASRGMDDFRFEVPTSREVLDFRLTVAMNTEHYATYTEPQGESVRLQEKTGAPYRLATWAIDRAVAAPRLGIIFFQRWPYAPSHEMVIALPTTARAVGLFLPLAMLTWLILGGAVRLSHLALLGALFLLPFLPLFAGGLPAPANVTPADWASWQMNQLPLLSVIPLVGAALLLRRQPLLSLFLTLLLMALFMSGYPFLQLRLDEQQRNAAESLIQAGMVAYVFGLALFSRIRPTPPQKAAESQ